MIKELLVIFSAGLALAAAVLLFVRLRKLKVENQKAKEISDAIHEGAMVFLTKQYKVLGAFVVVVAVAIGFIPQLGWPTAACLVAGAVFSVLAGNVSLRLATAANVLVAEADNEAGHKESFFGWRAAFSSSSIVGLATAGLGLLGLSLIYLIFKNQEFIYGFGFGASSVALFARLGGGIYSNAVDVGIGLVGQTESDIPENDWRHPAVIAKNVGTNVGDVVGAGADLFESYVDSMIVTMVLAAAAVAVSGANIVILPLLVAAAGLLSSLIGGGIIYFKKKGKLTTILKLGVFVAAGLTAILTWPLIFYLLGRAGQGLYWSVLSGLIAGVIISLVTAYYTSAKSQPTQTVARSAESGSAPHIISGLALGLISLAAPVLIVCLVIFLSYTFANVLGLAIAAVGLLSISAIILATNAYCPSSSTAANIAAMTPMSEAARPLAESLAATGNPAAGKGFAAAAAALTALVLLVGFGQAVKLETINLFDNKVMIGLFIGGLLPGLFCAFSIKAVNWAARQTAKEIRRQFKEIPGLITGQAKPDYKRGVEISTRAALTGMAAPALLAILAPIVVGLILGAEALAGLLASSIVMGFVLAIIMVNSGSALDNAKKFIESGNLGGRGSVVHQAAEAGSAVGKLFKDLAGPSLNILIKLMAIIGIIIAPLILAMNI